ncbi:TRAP transporter small permease subunit [Kordiimonas marina]|uniref:TRAP transporter small permease subunit n=1 Tax=Kordiimonas marina TaxID=2872312 RepID=UPI001FF49495|nr:TRAP transporter small permease subunit [Kordiimonas marina]MCJ9429172.1 TRAP transporter small permease subunit [Kordiimonas marina]
MLDHLADRLETILEKSGRILSVLPLILVLVQFAIVLMVYVFATGSIKLQESLQYINALMFLGAAGYTAIHDGHVRVDVFYSKFNRRRRAQVNFWGTLLLLVPFLILMWVSAVPYVLDSWSILEESVESSGLPFVYILKSTLLLFTFTLSLHAIISLIRNRHALKRM